MDTLVRGAFPVEQRFVQVQQRPPQVDEQLTIGILHGVYADSGPGLPLFCVYGRTPRNPGRFIYSSFGVVSSRMVVSFFALPGRVDR